MVVQQKHDQAIRRGDWGGVEDEPAFGMQCTASSVVIGLGGEGMRSGTE